MTIKLSGSGPTGLANPKGYRTRDSDMAVWSTVGVAFEAYNAVNIADYGIVASETGASGVYSFTDPADTTPGRFRLIAAAGASQTVADVANNTFWEDAAGPQQANAIQLAAQTITAAAGVTFPSSVASPTNITAGTITTVSNVIGLTAANLDATISSRMATYAQPTGFLAAAFPSDPAGLAGLASVHGAGSWATATGFSTLDADGIRTAVGLATANLDTQLTDLPTNAELATALGTADDATLAQVALVKAKTDLIPAAPAAVGSAMTLTSAGLDAVVVETGLNARQAMSVMAAALAGVLSGAATTTIVIKAAGVPGTTRVTATVDGSGNRTALTLAPPA